MNKKTMKLTTSQFSKLHHLNKRTLHYYDDIGLFSPRYKG
ncbi:MerR family DNA-binding transcriptional regulator, partial [Coprobacillus cateniformis]|nr:MerR family DNA-binding transcriptional regulator [Coprobacillus cateniformis]